MPWQRLRSEAGEGSIGRTAKRRVNKGFMTFLALHSEAWLAPIRSMALLAVLSLAGCESLHTGFGESRADFLPFYSAFSDSTGVEELSPVGLFRYTEDKATGEEVYRFLWPFGLYRTLGEESFLQLFPIFYGKKQLDPNGLPETVNFIFPFVFWGESADEGFYIGNFFWGHLKGMFGKDDLYFRVAPIYMHFRDKGYYSTHVLFPLINWVWGDGNSGWRIFPFYGHYEKVDVDGRPVFDRSFVLWPLYIHNRNNLNSEHPSETYFFFPFYGQTTSATYSDQTILWPLFRWSSDTSGKEEQWDVRAPFPIVQIARGPKYNKTFIWPLFGIKSREGYFSQFALFPIQRYESEDTKFSEESRFWLMPFFWNFNYRYKTGPKAGLSRSEIKFWPLFKYRSELDGSVSLSVISPLWFKDPEGFDAIWDPLFRIYHERKQADGGVLTRVLWGMYSSLDDDQGESATIWPLLTSWGETDKDGSWLNILGGLWEERQRGRLSAYRLFWIPFGDDLEEAPAP